MAPAWCTIVAMTTVGSAKITFEADASGVSDELQAQLDVALRKIDGILDTMAGNVEQGARRAGSAVGGHISDGAEQADEAVRGVGGDAFATVEQAAATVGAGVAADFTEAADRADAALSGVDGSGFYGATAGASSAASSVAGRFVEEAGRADAALAGIDGDGFASVTSSSSRAAGSMRDVMQQAASDAAGAWRTAADEISAAWGRVDDRMAASGGGGGGIAGKIAGAGGAFMGLAGATNVAMSAFDKNTSIEDTTAVLEVLMGSADEANTLMDDLVESNWVTPIPFDMWADAGKTLVAFGMDADDVSSTVTALGEAGAATGDGAEGLQRLSRAFGQALATGTVQGDTLNQLAEAGVPALDILGNHYGKTAAEMKKMASEGLPAEEAIAVLTEGIMEGTDGVAGSTAAFSGTMAELAGTTSGTLGNLGAAFTNVASTAMDPLLDGLRDFAQWLTEALYSFQDFIKWLQEGGPQVRLLGTIVGIVAGAIMTFLLPAFVHARVQGMRAALSNVKAWLLVRTEAIKATVTTVKNIGMMIGRWVVLGAQALVQGARIAAGWVLAMGPIGWAIAAIVGIGAVFVTLWNTSEGFREFWIGLWDTVKSAASSAWQWIKDAWDSYGQPVVDFVVSAFQWLGDMVALYFRLVGAAFEVLMTGLGKAWEAWGQPVVDLVVSYFLFAWGNLQAVLGWIGDRWAQLWTWAGDTWDSYGHPVVDIVVSGFQWLGGKLAEFIVWIIGHIRRFTDAVAAIWGEYVQPMIDRVTDGFTSLLDTIKGWRDNVIGWFSDAGSWLLQAGKDIVQGIIDGVKSMGGAVWDTFMDLLPGWVKDPFKEALGIQSPSKVFAQYGRDIGDGLVAGVAAAHGDVVGATEGLADAALEVTRRAPAVPVPAVATASGQAAPGGDGPVPVGVDTEAMLQSTLPAFDAVEDGHASMASAMEGTATGVVAPAWRAMGTHMSAVQSGVIAPTMGRVQADTMAMARQINGQVHGVANPALTGLGGHLVAVQRGTINPAFDGLKSGMQSVADAFGHGARDVGIHMENMRQATADPVRVTMNQIFSDGLVDMWNSVSDQIGTTKMAKKYASFHTGGIMPGYTPGRDVHRFFSPTGGVLDLSGGEPVLRPEVGKVLGSDWVHGVNSAARAEGTHGVARFLEHQHQHHANGGFVKLARGGYIPQTPVFGGGVSAIGRSHEAFIERFFPGIFTLTSANRPGDSGYHGSGHATDWQDSGAQWPTPASKALSRAIAATYPSSLELIHWPTDGWSNIKNGRPFNYDAGTNRDHANHIHWATAGPVTADGIAGALTAGDPIDWNIDWGSMLRGMVQEHLQAIDATAGAFNFPGNVGQVPVKTWEGMREPALTAMAESMEAHFKAMGGGSGAERWRPLAMQALARHGYNPAEHIEAMLQQIAIESAGDPTVWNMWDSNYLRGTPSGGLLQVIEPTYRRVRNAYPEAFEGLPDDMLFPLTNLTAGVGAVRMDWGGPAGRWPTRAGYEHGGLMPEGEGWFKKTAIKPERVLSPRQTGAFERLVEDITDRQPGTTVQPAGQGGGGDYAGARTVREVHVTQNIVAADPKRTADVVESRLLALVD